MCETFFLCVTFFLKKVSEQETTETLAVESYCEQETSEIFFRLF